ncbi:uncharacterized protein LOC111065850 [Drosophila obscura]|uniref:uncharacterized protein LOC111065850 n=1 Tax=Drosophila obscura TaxID=7282 RepID=UPI001BB1C267|nr:uncharacterized protein LOC111065850 [Drosophila obscura]
MVYFNIVLGLCTVVVAAGIAIYYSSRNYQYAPPHQSQRRRCEEEYAHNNGDCRPRNKFDNQHGRKSKPGDLCPICQDEMQSDNMHQMQCGHALHNACFEAFRYIRRDCLLCHRSVNLSLPGDDCTICLDPLTQHNMLHLPCQHAMHNECLAQYKASGATNCSICRASI